MKRLTLILGAAAVAVISETVQDNLPLEPPLIVTTQGHADFQGRSPHS